ncbi:MAG TPA: hypothetical protein VJ913_11550 [Actinomycetota bacterium]|nr:hypothetical protein [Actinomycetota bacterium]
MRFRAVLVLVVPFLLITTACADPPADPGGPSAGSEPTRYEADGTVLESPEHGPELCLGGIADSLPPQCGGLRIADWDWADVDGEGSLRGTTWGEFHVVGTYDGETLTVLEVGRYRPPSSERTDFTAPCPEPTGGWAVVDASRVSDADLQAVMHAAEDEPDSAGFWIDYIEEPEESIAPQNVIAIAAFTEDLERHETELREIWGGALCVAHHDRTQGELQRIQRELSGQVGEELGLEVTWSSGSVVDNLVEVGVIVAGSEAAAAVEERYGAGAVELVPALEPVDDSA